MQPERRRAGLFADGCGIQPVGLDQLYCSFSTATVRRFLVAGVLGMPVLCMGLQWACGAQEDRKYLYQ